MCPIKLRTKPVFRIFHILKINRIMPFCNSFIERPSYTGLKASKFICKHQSQSIWHGVCENKKHFVDVALQ